MLLDRLLINKTKMEKDKNDNWLEKWNNRYRQDTYAFGVEPNDYFKASLAQWKPGRILFPAEGEGRNAVYAATLGWEVYAFDISEEGKRKALRLAKNHGVSINYEVGDLPVLAYRQNQFDAIALIYAHFPAEIKSSYHQLLDRWLRSGGVIIFEAFSKNHLPYRAANPQVGGPTDLDSLFSIEELQADFPNYLFLTIEEKTIELNEGEFHVGRGSVIRFIAQKR